MEVPMEREAGALGGLFQQIVSDMKVSERTRARDRAEKNVLWVCRKDVYRISAGESDQIRFATVVGIASRLSLRSFCLFV